MTTDRRISGFDVSAERFNFDRGVRLWLFRQGLTDVQVAKPIECETARDNQVMDPTLELDFRVAQALLDALWSVGLRPNNGEGANAQVTAIKAHLEDMRKLVFEPKGGNR